MIHPPTIRLAWSQQASPVLVPVLWCTVAVTGLLFLLGLLLTMSEHSGTLAVAMFGPLLISGTLLYFRAGRRRAGRLELHPAGALALQRGLRRLWFPRDEVTAVLRAGPRVLRLDMRSGAQFRLGLESETGPDGTPLAEQLRAHLGLGSGGRALTVALRPMVGAFTSGLLAFLLLEMAAGFVSVLVGLYPALVMSFIPLVLAPSCGRKMALSRLTVGEDGVLLERFVSRRVLRYGDVAGAEVVSGHGIRLVERSGREQIHFAFGQGATELSELVRQIRVQSARYAANAEPTGDALARGDRTIAEWRRALGQLALAGGGFRQVTMAPEVLHRIVVDAAAPLDRRVGAALALLTVDPTAAPRIRLAAEGSAEARVRLALEATVGDDGQLDEHALDRATR
jgi:hypothetical protein